MLLETLTKLISTIINVRLQTALAIYGLEMQDGFAPKHGPKRGTVA